MSEYEKKYLKKLKKGSSSVSVTYSPLYGSLYEDQENFDIDSGKLANIKINQLFNKTESSSIVWIPKTETVNDIILT